MSTREPTTRKVKRTRTPPTRSRQRTVRRRSAVRDSQRRSRMLAAAAFEGLAFLHEGLFDDCNEQMARLLGGRRRELLKTPFLDCVAPQDRPAVSGILAQGKCGPCEFAALRRDGTPFVAEMQTRAAVIGGKAVRVVAVRDLGERKRAEQALRAS